MISMLKAECGANYTSKLEGMFTDMDLSRDVMTTFSSYLSTLPNVSTDLPTPTSTALSTPTSTALRMVLSPSSTALLTDLKKDDFSVQVLSPRVWPNTTNPPRLLPPSLHAKLDQFNTFYASKYQGRRLTWAHHLDKCIVVARFPKGKKELDVSFYQALVLSCFNLSVNSNLAEEEREKGHMTLLNLTAATGLEKEELRRVLQSSTCGEIGTRVLTKTPKGKEVSDEDVFAFNSEFTSKLFRIRIKSFQVKETEAEIEVTNEEVFRDRQYAVDAIIMRIMKAQKQCYHANLLGEILTQLKFPVSNADIKRRIESLIERDYLERDKNDSNIYRYLA